MDASALMPFSLPSSLPILFPFHMHLITHHTPLPSTTYTSRFPTFPSPTLSSRILFPLYTPLPPSPNILPSSFLLPLHFFPHPLPDPTCLCPFLFPPHTPPSSAFPMCE